MNWDTGQLFEILAVGDGFFMYRVLMAVSMMWSSGIFASLGALGLLLGLLIIGAQGVSSGGQKMDLGSLFTGFILWAILFGGGASVQVTEVGFTRPGSGGTQSYVIDDVPFGVAAAGWLVSNVGKEMTETMEQAFGLVTEPTSVLKTGHGRSLEWLAAVRMARNMNVGSGDSKFAVERANLIGYMRYCSSQAIVRDPGRAATMTYTADPLDANTAFGFESGWVTMEWWEYVPSGKPTKRVPDPTCTEALGLLRGYWQNGGGAFNDFANTVAKPMGYSGSGAPSAQAAEATAALNLTLDNAQKYMVGSMMAGLWSEALSGSPVLTDEQIANRLMMTQAVEQRATEAAAEESMFRRTMFPLMTFLESTLYICTPFMALAVGLGRAGIGITAKYGLVTLWLALWLPTLAVINMFQITSFQSSFTALTQPFAGGGSYTIGAVATSLHVEDQVLDWLSTGSMLAAATPMISLMFLMGSAYTATSLAGAFKGSDVINEKLPSPDIAESKAAMGRSTMTSHSAVGGTVHSQASIPNFDFGSSRSIGAASTNTASMSALQSWSQGQGKAVALENAFMTMAGVRGSQQSAERSEVAAHNAAQMLQRSGVDFGTSTQTGQRMAMQFAEAYSGSASTDMLAGIKGALGKLAAARGSGAIKQIASDTGTKLGANMQQHDMIAAVADTMSRMATSIQTATQKDQGLRAAVTSSNVASAEEFGAVQGSTTARATNSAEFRQAKQASEQLQNSFSQNAGWNAAVASNQRIPLNELQQMVSGAGYSTKDLVGLANTLGVPMDAIQAGAKANAHWAAGGTDQATQAAVLQALSGNLPGYTGGAALGTDQQREALAGILTKAGVLSQQTGAAQTNNPNSNANVAPTAAAAGQEARQAVEGAGVGVGDANAFAANVQGQVAGLQTHGGRADAMGDLGGMGLPVSRALAAGGRGASVNGGGGTVDAAAAAGHQAPVLAAGAAAEAAAFTSGQQRQAPGFTAQQDHNQALSNSFLGHFGTAPTWGMGHLNGFPMTGGAGGGVLGGEFGASGADNPLIPQMQKNIEGGQWTNGVPVDSNVATVLATYAGTNQGGGPPSPEQGAAFTEAKAALTPSQAAAVNNILNSMEKTGNPDPGEVSAASVAAVAVQPSFGGPTPQALDRSQAPAPAPAVPYSSYMPGQSGSFMEHVSYKDHMASPAEYSRREYQGFDGMPKQGENGNPVGPWQQAREDASERSREGRRVEESSGATGDW